MSEIQDLLDRHDAAWNDKDLDAAMASYTEDIVFENHTAGEPPSSVRQPCAHTSAASSSAGPTCASRRGASTCRRGSASASGPRARPPDGRRIEWDGVDVLPIRDGMIARKDVYSTSHIPREVA